MEEKSSGKAAASLSPLVIPECIRNELQLIVGHAYKFVIISALFHRRRHHHHEKLTRNPIFITIFISSGNIIVVMVFFRRIFMCIGNVI